MSEPRIIRALIEAYDPERHTATVRPLGHPTTVLQDVAVSADVPPELVTPDTRALVLVFGDVGQVLMAPYGGPPAYPLSGAANYENPYLLTAPAAMQPVPHPHLRVELETRVPSHFWLHFTGAYVAQNTRSWNLLCRALINDAPVGPSCIVDKVTLGGWYQLGLSYLTLGCYAPGTYAFQTGFVLQQKGDQALLGGVHLSVLATPAPPA